MFTQKSRSCWGFSPFYLLAKQEPLDPREFTPSPGGSVPDSLLGSLMRPLTFDLVTPEGLARWGLEEERS